MYLPNSIQLCFKINAHAPVSDAFRKMGIDDFKQAMVFVKNLPYKRNSNKNDILTVVSDMCGTCGTKHATIKELADENGFHEIDLVIGLYKMNGSNTPKTLVTLQKHQLDYIPEAHCYLKYNKEIFELTNARSKASDFVSDLIEETKIEPKQIADFKVNYQQNYLKNWLKQNPQINYTLEEIWKIREQCIKDLSSNDD